MQITFFMLYYLRAFNFCLKDRKSWKGSIIVKMRLTVGILIALTLSAPTILPSSEVIEIIIPENASAATDKNDCESPSQRILDSAPEKLFIGADDFSSVSNAFQVDTKTDTGNAVRRRITPALILPHINGSVLHYPHFRLYRNSFSVPRVVYHRAPRVPHSPSPILVHQVFPKRHLAVASPRPGPWRRHSLHSPPSRRSGLRRPHNIHRPSPSRSGRSPQRPPGQRVPPHRK